MCLSDGVAKLGGERERETGKLVGLVQESCTIFSILPVIHFRYEVC